MNDFLLISTILSIGAANLIAYFLGRYHGLEIGLSIRAPSRDDAPGDQFPIIPFHARKD